MSNKERGGMRNPFFLKSSFFITFQMTKSNTMLYFLTQSLSAKTT